MRAPLFHVQLLVFLRAECNQIWPGIDGKTTLHLDILFLAHGDFCVCHSEFGLQLRVVRLPELVS